MSLHLLCSPLPIPLKYMPSSDYIAHQTISLPSSIGLLKSPPVLMGYFQIWLLSLSLSLSLFFILSTTSALFILNGHVKVLRAVHSQQHLTFDHSLSFQSCSFQGVHRLHPPGIPVASRQSPLKDPLSP